MTRKSIKIGFMDFGRSDTTFSNWVIRLLQNKYDVIVSDTPDYVFYILSGQTHHSFNGIRIFWSGENVVPNFNYCDYALGFQHLTFEDRYCRFPSWRPLPDKIEQVMHKTDTMTDADLLNRDFCATVISNATQTDGMRERAFEELTRYKPVASGGKWRNNVGGRVPDKIAFQHRYKFALAFENTYASGYTTEKILEAFASACVPIYYGDPRVTEDFNPDSFINAHDFDSMASLRAFVERLDTDDALYLKMVRAPAFRGNKLPEALSDEALLKFFSTIFDGPIEEARRRFYAKPYQDIDVNNMKWRDFKAVCKGFLRKTFHR